MCGFFLQFHPSAVEDFMIIFNFFSINLSCFHDLGRGFCRPFLNKNVFKIIFFVFNFWITLFILYKWALFYKKNIYSEIIFFICLALHNIFFLLFYSVLYLFLFLLSSFHFNKRTNNISIKGENEKKLRQKSFNQKQEDWIKYQDKIRG